MANKKYATKTQALEARRICNKMAQRRYRDKKKQNQAGSKSSQQSRTIENETDGEALSAVQHPDASEQEASSEVENTPNKRRRPNPSSAPLTPLEHLAIMDQSIEALSVIDKDACDPKSLMDGLTRIRTKLQDVVNHVHEWEHNSVQQDASTSPSNLSNPHKSTAVLGKTHNTEASEIQALSARVRMCRDDYEVEGLVAQLEEFGYRRFEYSKPFENTYACIL